MILVTGATGNLGSSVIKQLDQIISKDQFIATSSSDDGVHALKEKGYQARLANFNDLDLSHNTFNGVEKILLISTMDQNRFEQHKNVIDSAKAKGVQHIIYTSLAIKNIETSAVHALMKSHFETEEYLIDSGVTYTILRNTMYADALTQILGAQALQQNIQLPGGEGKVPYVLRREMGEATANLLTQTGHENKIYNIVGSNSYSYQDIANGLSKLLGKSITYENVSEEDYVARLKTFGFPEFAIYLHAGTIKDIKSTQYEIQDVTLEKLLGKPTASLSEFLEELFIKKNRYEKFCFISKSKQQHES